MIARKESGIAIITRYTKVVLPVSKFSKSICKNQLDVSTFDGVDEDRRLKENMIIKLDTIKKGIFDFSAFGT